MPSWGLKVKPETIDAVEAAADMHWGARKLAPWQVCDGQQRSLNIRSTPRHICFGFVHRSIHCRLPGHARDAEESCCSSRTILFGSSTLRTGVYRTTSSRRKVNERTTRGLNRMTHQRTPTEVMWLILFGVVCVGRSSSVAECNKKQSCAAAQAVAMRSGLHERHPKPTFLILAPFWHVSCLDVSGEPSRAS